MAHPILSRYQTVVIAKMARGWILICDKNPRRKLRYWLEKSGMRKLDDPLWIDVAVKSAEALLAGGYVGVSGHEGFTTRHRISPYGLETVRVARLAGTFGTSGDPPTEELRSTKASRAASRAIPGKEGR